jgi:hypothetical protein
MIDVVVVAVEWGRETVPERAHFLQNPGDVWTSGCAGNLSP